MIWQMMVAVLPSNGQLRTEREGDRERMSKNCSTAADYSTDDDCATRMSHWCWQEQEGRPARISHVCQ